MRYLSLEKAGFALAGIVRFCEFRAGQWHDGYLYSRPRTGHVSVALNEDWRMSTSTSASLLLSPANRLVAAARSVKVSHEAPSE